MGSRNTSLDPNYQLIKKNSQQNSPQAAQDEQQPTSESERAYPTCTSDEVQQIPLFGSRGDEQPQEGGVPKAPPTMLISVGVVVIRQDVLHLENKLHLTI